MLDSGWNVRQLLSAAPGVEFENTNALGKGKKYARFKVPGGGYLYPAYDLNHAYEETDVFVSMAKLKNHETCGVTLSLKNCFGITPASIYGDDAGVDEPNESPTKGRSARVPPGQAAARRNRRRRSWIRHRAASRLSRAAHRGRPGDGAADRSGHHRRHRIGGRRRGSVDQRTAAGAAGRADRRNESRVHGRGGDGRDGLRSARRSRHERRSAPATARCTWPKDTAWARRI